MLMVGVGAGGPWYCYLLSPTVLNGFGRMVERFDFGSCHYLEGNLEPSLGPLDDLAETTGKLHMNCQSVPCYLKNFFCLVGQSHLVACKQRFPAGTSCVPAFWMSCGREKQMRLERKVKEL